MTKDQTDPRHDGQAAEPLALRLNDQLGPWTACDQQLPDSGTEVLVWRAPVYKLILRGHVALSTCRYTKSGPVWDCDQGSWVLPRPLVRRVTHWMPKPEGPNADWTTPVRADEDALDAAIDAAMRRACK